MPGPLFRVALRGGLLLALFASGPGMLAAGWLLSRSTRKVLRTTETGISSKRVSLACSTPLTGTFNRFAQTGDYQNWRLNYTDSFIDLLLGS